MQLINAPVPGGNNEIEEVEEEVEEKEEEEDPEEDPNWAEEAVPRTPTPRIGIEEDVNQEPNQAIWDFDQDLEIPDCGRREPEIDTIVWRDIYVENECPLVINEVIPEPVVPEPMEIENEDKMIRRETQEIVDRLWEEAGRKLEIEENHVDEQGMRVGEEEINHEEEKEVGGNEEDEEHDHEVLVRPTKKRRLTVREYLSQFVHKDDGSSSSRGQLPSPTPDDSE